MGAKAIEDFEKEIMSPKDITKVLRYSLNTVYKKAVAGEIPSEKRGGRRIFFKADIMNYLRTGKVK